MAKKKGDEKSAPTPLDVDGAGFDDEPDFDDPPGFVDDVTDQGASCRSEVMYSGSCAAGPRALGAAV